MKSYYITSTCTTTAHSDTWGAAKKIASAALKAGIYPVGIQQRTMIDGRSPHRRQHVLIESPDCDQSLVKTENRWECTDSFYSHIRPSISL